MAKVATPSGFGRLEAPQERAEVRQLMKPHDQADIVLLVGG